MNSTGPFMVTKIYDCSQINDVKILPSRYLDPFTKGEINFRLLGVVNELTELMVQEAYAVHLFSGTWLKSYFLNLSVSIEYLEKVLVPLNISVSDEDFEICERVTLHKGFRDFSSLKNAEQWLQRVYFSNKHKKVYSEAAFSKIFATFWFAACFHSRHLGIGLWKAFSQSSLNIPGRIPVNLKIKLFLLFLIHSCLYNSLTSRSATIAWSLRKFPIFSRLMIQIQKPN
jgi:hypothetical protein